VSQSSKQPFEDAVRRLLAQLIQNLAEKRQRLISTHLRTLLWDAQESTERISSLLERPSDVFGFDRKSTPIFMTDPMVINFV
jgi:hypothetical protein